MAQKVKHNKMIGFIQIYKKTSADKKAAARKAESKRQEQLGNFGKPKISNLFKRKDRYGNINVFTDNAGKEFPVENPEDLWNLIQKVGFQ